MVLFQKLIYKHSLLVRFKLIRITCLILVFIPNDYRVNHAKRFFF